MSEQAREHVRKLILIGDNRLKQGDGRLAGKARETFLQALAEAEAAGVADERLRGLLQLRIDACDRLGNDGG